MEQKRTLWIVAAAGVFLLVVVGAALILYAPSNGGESVQSVYSPASGFVSLNVQPYEKTAPKSPFESHAQNKADPIAADTVTAPAPADQERAFAEALRSDNLTVYSNSTTVYGGSSTTFDLNSLRTTPVESNVTAKNEYTASQIESQAEKNIAKAKPAADDSYYTPAPQKKAETVSKPAVTKASESTKASSAGTKTASAKATAKTPAKKAAPKAADRFWVQAASYTNKKNADEARTTLESNKIPSEVFTYTDAKGKIYYRVRVGPYTTSSEAEYWQKRVAMIDSFASTPSYVVNSSAKAN